MKGKKMDNVSVKRSTNETKVRLEKYLLAQFTNLSLGELQKIQFFPASTLFASTGTQQNALFISVDITKAPGQQLKLTERQKSQFFLATNLAYGGHHSTFGFLTIQVGKSRVYLLADFLSVFTALATPTVRTFLDSRTEPETGSRP
jgi:hypothetical protein